MVGFWDKLYQSDSLTAKCLSLSRHYGTFRNTYSFLKKSQWWSREELEAYQLQQLKQLVHHAYENVPYYQRVFDERNLKPEDIQSLSDLQKLPFLTKDIVRENLEDLKAQNYPEEAFEYVTTGGSTGIPLGFYYESGVSRAKEWAFMKTQWDRVGYHFHDKCVILRGNVINSSDTEKYWEKSFFGRWLVLSSYHLTQENVSNYISEIKKFGPKYIQAYPSTIIILAKHMQENQIKPIQTLKAILCGSENIYPWQRELVEKMFQCRVYSWYGNSEQVVLAGECEYNQEYHIFPEYSIFELIRNDGTPIHHNHEIGEVVGTGLNNYIFPLIRYRTMDHATLNSKDKCKCGRNYFRLDKVVGRQHEYIVTERGNLIAMTAINMHSDIFDNVHQFQFYQEKKGEVFLHLVKKYTYTDHDSQNILQALHHKMGDEVRVELKFVDEIPRTKSGKYRFLIQEISINDRD